MKLRNLLITLGLTLTVGAGVAVCLNAQQNDETKTAEAASTACDVYFKASWPNETTTINLAKVHYWNGGDHWMEMTPVYLDGGSQVYKYTIPAGNNEFQYQIQIKWGSGDWEWKTSVNKTVTNNMLCTPVGKGGWSDGNFTLNQGSAYPYTINYNGNGSTSGSMSSEIAYGNVSWGLKSNAFAKTGRIFDSWNTKADGSGESYSNQGLLPVKTNTNAITLYAQWADNNSPTVYFVNGYSWQKPYVYYWGGGTSVGDPGVEMTQTAAKLYCKVGDWTLPINIYTYTISGNPTGILFDDGNMSEGHKTGDLIPNNGSIYWYGVNAGTFGDVASFLVTLMNSMGSHTYDGKTYPQSICTISSTDSLVTTYESLLGSGDEEVVASIQNSTIYTYATPVTDPTGAKTDIAIPDLIAQIQKNNPNSGNGALRIFGLLDLSNNNGALIIIVIASLGILSVGGYYFFRKSRKTEE